MVSWVRKCSILSTAKSKLLAGPEVLQPSAADKHVDVDFAEVSRISLFCLLSYSPSTWNKHKVHENRPSLECAAVFNVSGD